MQNISTSTLNPRTLAQGIRLGDVQWDSDGQTLVWLEGARRRACWWRNGAGWRQMI